MRQPELILPKGFAADGTGIALRGTAPLRGQSSELDVGELPVGSHAGSEHPAAVLHIAGTESSALRAAAIEPGARCGLHFLWPSYSSLRSDLKKTPVRILVLLGLLTALFLLSVFNTAVSGSSDGHLGKLSTARLSSGAHEGQQVSPEGPAALATRGVPAGQPTNAAQVKSRVEPTLASAQLDATQRWLTRLRSLPTVSARTLLHCSDDEVHNATEDRHGRRRRTSDADAAREESLESDDGGNSRRKRDDNSVPAGGDGWDHHDAAGVAEVPSGDSDSAKQSKYFIDYSFGVDAAARRSCMIQNACLDSQNQWVFYTGDDAVAASAGHKPLCIGSACDGQPFVHTVPLRLTNEYMIRPIVMHGAPGTMPPSASRPSGLPVREPAVRWYDDLSPAFVQWRHQPENYFHAISDDFYGLYWALRWPLHHPAYAADSIDGYGGSNTIAPGAERFTVINLIFDNWAFDLPSQRLATRFHHVRYMDAHSLRAKNPGVDLICFKRVLMGSPGITMHRNAAYAWHPARTWPNAINVATQAADEAAFARFLTARALVEVGVDARTYVAPTRDTIVVVDRGKKRGDSRRWANATNVLAAVAAAAAEENYVVRLTSFDGRPDNEIAAVMQRAVMMIGVHGAGLTNMLYMQPGSAVLEITPASNPETALYYGALARNIGLRHGTLVASIPRHRVPDFHDAVRVDSLALRAMIDLLLADVDGRLPT